MSLNISDYESKRDQHSYRPITEKVVENWSYNRLFKFLSDLTEDQLNERIPNFVNMSTEELKKLVCLVVWGWGWEGSDWFNHQSK